MVNNDIQAQAQEVADLLCQSKRLKIDSAMLDQVGEHIREAREQAATVIYYRTCRNHDMKICSGQYQGEPVPLTPTERHVCEAHADGVIQVLALRYGETKAEMHRIIRRWLPLVGPFEEGLRTEWSPPEHVNIPCSFFTEIKKL